MLINFVEINFLLGWLLPIHPSTPTSTKSVIMFRVKWSKGKARRLPPRQQLLAALRQPGQGSRRALAHGSAPAC